MLKNTGLWRGTANVNFLSSALRPEFFYFLVLGKFLGKPRVGGGNKNKNKIQKFPESE